MVGESRLRFSRRLLVDHEGYYRTHRRARAYRLKRIGLRELARGDRPAARTAFRQSLRASPSARTVWHLIRAGGPSVAMTDAVELVHFGAFSGIATQVRHALAARVQVRDFDAQRMARSKVMPYVRIRAEMESARHGHSWLKSKAWSVGLQRRLERAGACSGRSPVVVLGTLPALVLEPVCPLRGLHRSRRGGDVGCDAAISSEGDARLARTGSAVPAAGEGHPHVRTVDCTHARGAVRRAGESHRSGRLGPQHVAESARGGATAPSSPLLRCRLEPEGRARGARSIRTGTGRPPGVGALDRRCDPAADAARRCAMPWAGSARTDGRRPEPGRCAAASHQGRAVWGHLRRGHPQGPTRGRDRHRQHRVDHRRCRTSRVSG